jgi:uncharacterized membrane protein YhaH (DUF805 family)
MFSQFFGFRGRIGRGTWWITQLGLLLASLLLQFLMTDLTQDIKALAELPSPKKADIMAAFTQLGGLVIFLLVYGVLAQWLFLSSNIQRLHDRGNSGWRTVFAYVPILMFFLSGYLLLVQGDWKAAGIAVIMSIAGVFISSLWMIIECGMLAGEDCENDYGDPPGEAARALALQKELAHLRGEPTSIEVASPAVSSARALPQGIASSNAQSTFGRR